MCWILALLFCSIVAPLSFAGATGVQVGVAVNIPSGADPFIIATLPINGSTITNPLPQLQVAFNIDMDTSKTDVNRIALPVGLTVRQLVWVNPRTLNILYDGLLTTFGAMRVDLAERYFLSVGQKPLPVGSSFAFNYINNLPPIITLVASGNPNPSPAFGSVGFSVAAIDLENDAITYDWDFGDGSAGEGLNPAHRFVSPGDYIVSVTASDGRGGLTRGTVVIRVTGAPGIPQIIATTPIDGDAVPTPSPLLRFVFDMDMDASRTDVSKIGMPAGLLASQLMWRDARTLEIMTRGTMPTFGSKRVDLFDGYFINTVGVPIANGAGLAFSFGDASTNNRPQIITGPLADPPIITLGVPIRFTTNATDADGDALSYSWNFGDGSLAEPGQDVTHTFTSAGPFIVIVVVDDGKGGQSTGTLIMAGAATEPGNGAGNDFLITTIQLKLGFKKPGKDKLKVSGALNLPPGWDPSGKIINVDFGGVAQTFTLNAKGKAVTVTTVQMGTTLKKGKDKLSVKRKLVKKVFKGGASSVTFTMAGDFAPRLVDDGYTNTTTTKLGVTVSVSTLMVIDGAPRRARADTIYMAKANKTGKASLKTAVK